jgi:hypothetical protein
MIMVSRFIRTGRIAELPKHRVASGSQIHTALTLDKNFPTALRGLVNYSFLKINKRN